MKKIYTSIFVLFLSFSMYGQTDPDLFGQWFFHYMEINGTITYAPPVTNNPTIYITFNNDANPGSPSLMGDSSCNTFLGNYEVNNTNTSVNLFAINPTLLLCQGDTFETTYLSILGNYPTNFFDYTVDIPNESLTMIDLLGVKLVYGRQALSIEDKNAFSNRIKLYPNPAQKEVLMTGISINSKTTYSIYNLIGNVVVSERSLNQNQIDVAQLKAGVYFVKIKQQGKTAIKKFIKI